MGKSILLIISIAITLYHVEQVTGLSCYTCYESTDSSEFEKCKKGVDLTITTCSSPATECVTAYNQLKSNMPPMLFRGCVEDFIPNGNFCDFFRVSNFGEYKCVTCTTDECNKKDIL